MKLEPFELERIQSIWEHRVKYNMTESGVEPLRLGELLKDEGSRQTLLDTSLGYSQTNGTIPLRELISSSYSNAGADNVLVTNGGAEANLLSVWRFLHEHKGTGELVMMLPNYMQIHGAAIALGGKVNPFYLKMKRKKWVPDLKGLKNSITKDTVAIVICAPNNPTGAVFDKNDLTAIAEIADDSNLWILSDEIYRGTELNGIISPSMFEHYDKVLVTSSLSKAFGLPGLRLGWIVSSSKKVAEELWAYSDYTTICPTKMSDWLAAIALQPENREKIQQRSSMIVKEHWAIMKSWLDSHSDVFKYVAPRAASICFPKHNLDISSLELVDRLLKEKSVLIIPGEHFGMPNYLRIGFGQEKDQLKEGLSLITEMIESLT
jgi:aspartate/methionine/tyrosine aminotransferase